MTEPEKVKAGVKWLRFTARMLALHMIEDENFLLAFSNAAMAGAQHPMQALDWICKHYRKTVKR